MSSSASEPANMHTAVRSLLGKESVTVTVYGECMQPLIRDSAQLQVTPSRFYLPGDVVVALSPTGSYLVHRVIGMYRKAGILKIVTRADNGSRPDSAVCLDALLGKVSGGDCHADAVSVPLVHRLRGVRHFICFIAARYAGRAR